MMSPEIILWSRNGKNAATSRKTIKVSIMKITKMISCCCVSFPSFMPKIDRAGIVISFSKILSA